MISPRAIFASPAAPAAPRAATPGRVSTSVICPSLSVTALKLASRSIWYTTSETSPRMENAELLWLMTPNSISPLKYSGRHDRRART